MDEVSADSAPPVASATSSAPPMSAPAMSVTTLASATAEMLDSTSAPLIDMSLAKGAAQSADAPQAAPKKRKVAAPAIVSDSISDK